MVTPQTEIRGAGFPGKVNITRPLLRGKLSISKHDQEAVLGRSFLEEYRPALQGLVDNSIEKNPFPGQLGRKTIFGVIPRSQVTGASAFPNSAKSVLHSSDALSHISHYTVP